MRFVLLWLWPSFDVTGRLLGPGLGVGMGLAQKQNVAGCMKENKHFWIQFLLVQHTNLRAPLMKSTAEQDEPFMRDRYVPVNSIIPSPFELLKFCRLPVVPQWEIALGGGCVVISGRETT